MAEEDIYGSKKDYESFLARLEEFAVEPKYSEKFVGRGKRKYWCRNKSNLDYFKILHNISERQDHSYKRRLDLIRAMKFVTWATEKNIKDCEREDIDKIVAESHKVNISIDSKKTFIRDLKYIWRQLFPERDEKGRIDASITPYAVRHLTRKIDKSREKRRRDKLTPDQIDKLMNYFNSNPMVQFYIALAVESLGRPQELGYLRIRDVDIYDNYAKIYVSEHGKEGTKFLQVIESYPYLIKWLENHPYAKDPDSFLFILKRDKSKQFCPHNVNQHLQKACEKLGIPKISAYSLKRNGVTFARLKGESDVDIQHKAGWTSTKQINTYDQSDANDVFKKQLAKHGLIKENSYKAYLPALKECVCGNRVGFSERICPKCKRLIHQEDIKKQMKADDLTTQVLKKIGEQNKELILKAMAELGVRKV